MFSKSTTQRLYLDTSNVASAIATQMKMSNSVRCAPGHDRLPKTCLTRVQLLIFTKEPLQIEYLLIGICFRVGQDEPTSNMRPQTILTLVLHEPDVPEETRPLGEMYAQRYAPKVMTTFHRRSSLQIAFTYRSASPSPIVGSLSFPTTTSVSACTFLRTSGYSVIARKKADNVDGICHHAFRCGSLVNESLTDCVRFT